MSPQGAAVHFRAKRRRGNCNPSRVRRVFQSDDCAPYPPLYFRHPQSGADELCFGTIPVTSPIFLDFQATTPLDSRVLADMLPWLRVPANPHSMQHATGLVASRAVDDARAQLARATGTQSEGILFTPGATFACNLVIRSFCGPGTRLVVSAIEHPCVMETARLCEVHGATLDIIPVTDGGLIDLDAAFELIEGAAFVSVMAVNNEIGTVQPIREIAEFCEAHGAVFHTDAAQALGRVSIDDLGSETIITLSSHKVYGPPGMGAVCASSENLARLEPLISGGGQQGGVHPGTIPTSLAVGFGRAAELAVAERENDWAHCASLSDRFVDRLTEHGISFERNGDPSSSIPHNLNVSFADVDADDLLGLLPEVALATGSACSSGAIEKSKVLEAMGLSPQRLAGAVRVGFGRPSRAEEIDEAADRIAAAIGRLTEGS